LHMQASAVGGWREWVELMMLAGVVMLLALLDMLVLQALAQETLLLPPMVSAAEQRLHSRLHGILLLLVQGDRGGRGAPAGSSV
jgi:hypothetical protein